MPFSFQDEAFIHHLLGNLEAMLVTEVMGGSPIIVYASASWVDLMGYDTAEDVLTLPAISVLGGSSQFKWGWEA